MTDLELISAPELSSVWDLDCYAPQDEIDDWFQWKKHNINRLIADTATTIGYWCEREPERLDLTKLKLAERGLSEGSVVRLLKAWPELGPGIPIIHILIYYSQGPILLSLLRQIRTPLRFVSLMRFKDAYDLNVLACACGWSQGELCPYILGRHDDKKTFDLLRECEISQGKTGLHFAAGFNHLPTLLPLFKNESEMQTLLSIEDNRGQTVLSTSIFIGNLESFQGIIDYYGNNKQGLLELAAIQDKLGNTSFHYAAGQSSPEFLRILIKSTYSFETREQLRKIIALQNQEKDQKILGADQKFQHSNNELIYKWANAVLSKEQFLLFNFPSVLVLYNVENREGAEVEAQSLIQCFKALNFDVDHDEHFTKDQLFQRIKMHRESEAGKNGQVIALMSHGHEGYICDADNKEIPLFEIEQIMCDSTTETTPKILILQCCQFAAEPNRESTNHTRSINAASSERCSHIEMGSTDQATISDWDLGNNATPEQIDDWFQSRQHDVARLISDLATTIGYWCQREAEGLDLQKLKLTERDFSEGNVVALLKSWPALGPGIPIIHLLIYYFQTPTLLSLLRQISKPHRFVSLMHFKDAYDLNVLACACGWSQGELCSYILTRHDDEKTFHRLCEREISHGQTGLHFAARAHHIPTLLPFFKNESQMQALLSIKDDRGHTVLATSIVCGSLESLQGIIDHYGNNKQGLLKLAAIQDNLRNTSFHYAAGQSSPDFLRILIKSTYSFETREQLREIISSRNVGGDQKILGAGQKFQHSDNELIYKWANDVLSEEQFLLFNFPSVLVLYNVKNREGAEIEAQSLIHCFKALDFDVDHGNQFTKDQLFQRIKKHRDSEASKNGQVVALMSHGHEGYICDVDNNEIPLFEIEQIMCDGSTEHTPKILILQCCQFAAEANRESTSHTRSINAASLERCSPIVTGSTVLMTDPRAPKQRRSNLSYSPRHPDFCVLASTGPGTLSERNQFIPTLAQEMMNMEIMVDISDLMYAVKRRFPQGVSNQAPFFLDGLKFGYCIKKILPLYLTIKRKKNRVEKI